MNSLSTQAQSPFHAGEQKMQTLMGVREKMETFGRRVIRPFMPEQHQQFYQQLPFLFVGHADDRGQPWASILCNQPGFISAIDEKHLNIAAQPLQGDPLLAAFQQADTQKVHLGLLGIELPTRRRNRLAGHITDITDNGITLTVDQCFGNCPQYIQSRDVSFIDTESLPAVSVEVMQEFDDEALNTLQQADTFFVASFFADGSGEASEGVDVSHRGGKPGFIRIDDHTTLTIPDYLGNNHFNTLGNIHENGKAGLLFIDFNSGDVLTMTGRAEVLLDSPDTTYFQGAERLWTFELIEARRIKNALPLRWHFNDYSANIALTGSWMEAAPTKQAERQRQQFLPYSVSDIVEESSEIKSFYLKPENGSIARFQAGQFLTLKFNVDGKEVLRTYTASSAPEDEHYRISVKHERASNDDHDDGLISSFLHSQINIGDTLHIKAATGSFHLHSESSRAAVLLSAGVGITPMISMARHALFEGFRTRKPKDITLISAARNTQQRAFFEELSYLSEQSAGSIRSFWALSQLSENQKPGDGSFHHKGRISKAFIQAILPLDDYDFYLCGPPAFMQDMYDLLRQLGTIDGRIYAEEFGPASLIRDVEVITVTEQQDKTVAEAALVTFIDASNGSEVEQQWSKDDGSLLDFAEAHGFTPSYGCRSGQCGACKVTLSAGEVSHHQADPSLITENDVLLCCAKPAAKENEPLPAIKIKL